MKDKIKKYVDDLFSDIYETKQLRELKEEVSANLLDKISDFVKSGYSEDDAFKKAVSSLGDMNELVESLKRASKEKFKKELFKTQPLDKKHVIGYVTASAILLFGMMVAGIVYLQMRDLLTTTGTLMPFFIVSVALFVYFGLTQETLTDYGMKGKRAFAYSLASAVLLFGIFVTGIVYFEGNELFEVLAAFMPFFIPSTVVFIYLGLTEKSRSKMDSEWLNQWVEYYSNPESMMLHGNISGALWIFTLAAFILIGLTLGWKYSWIVFIFAVGFQLLIEAFFAAKRKNN